MSIKQIKWHAAVLAVTVFAALTILFALATVTSNAAEAPPYDPSTHTYTLTGGTYGGPIELDENETTTLNISGDNILEAVISGSNAGLKITGNGTLDVRCYAVTCGDLTICDGAEVKLQHSIDAFGSVTIKNAKLESDDAHFSFGANDGNTKKHVFENAVINLKVSDQYLHSSPEPGIDIRGDCTFTNCDVTFVNGHIRVMSGVFTIDGGTFNMTRIPNVSFDAFVIFTKAVINNATVKADSHCMFNILEMTNSDIDINIPEEQLYQYGSRISEPAMFGRELTLSGGKVNIEGNAKTGICVYDNLNIKNNTEINVTAKSFGLLGTNIKINNASGKFRVTDPQANAAVAATTLSVSSDQPGALDPGTISLQSVNVKQPADYTIGQTTTTIEPDILNGAPEEISITAILEGNAPAKTVILESGHATHTWDAGKVTTEPTETAEGVKTYTCTVCGATKTEAIPKLSPQGSQDSNGTGKGEDGTPFGKGASVEAAEAAILALPNDNDPAGTAFGLLQLKATKVTKNSINLKWKAVPGATKYILFANKCGTGNKYKKLGEVTGTSYTATQAAGAAIQKGTYYKFMMIAADSSGKVVSTSKTVHAATKGGKVGNHKKVTVSKSVTKKAKKLKKGKTLKLKAKAVPQAKKLKVKKHRGIMYESSNPAVAQVNSKGTVKGVTKGTCYIYAYAQNGTCAKVKVTVK